MKKMTLKKRIESPTPTFFKKIQRWGILIAAIGGAVLTAPATLPAVVVTIAGYLTVAGTVATAVSQAATPHDVAEDPDGQ